MTDHSKPLLDCRDGYRAELVVKNDGRTELYLEKIVQGKLVGEPHLAMYAEQGDWQEVAAVRREYALFSAMCRYLNAGGDMQDLQEATLRMDCYYLDQPRLSLPPNIKLLDVLEEGTHQMLLLDENEQVTIVTEDEWVDQVPLEHLASRIPGVPVEPYHDDLPKL